MSQENTTTMGETGNLDRDALLMRFIKAIVDERYADVLAAADAASLAAYAETDSVTVKPRFNGMVLGTRTVAEPKPKMVIADTRAFEAWAESGEHGAWKFVVDSTWANAVLKYAQWDEEKQVAFDKHGEVIPGVQQLPAAAPSSVTQKPNAAAFEKLTEMLRDGEFTADLRALAPALEVPAEPGQ
ncbi:hypothetical protein AB0O47_32140 [Streptomyces noursei]|uniref:hypothetical protein n=1 Tax=Streptomyces noursei TaxID=1971 RepID=UPI00344E8489